MNALLNRAAECAKKANTDVSFKRPDRAYVEWLISSEILSILIPRHRDYPTLNKDQGETRQRYRNLYKVGWEKNLHLGGGCVLKFSGC